MPRQFKTSRPNVIHKKRRPWGAVSSYVSFAKHHPIKDDPLEQCMPILFIMYNKNGRHSWHIGKKPLPSYATGNRFPIINHLRRRLPLLHKFHAKQPLNFRGDHDRYVSQLQRNAARHGIKRRRF